MKRLQAPKLPPSFARHYDLKPRIFPIPPYDSAAMMHRYENPAHCRTSTEIFSQFPKRKDRLPIRGTAPDMYTGWGLHIIEGVDLRRVFKLGVAALALSFVASLVFGIAWSLSGPNREIGDAFTIAGWIVGSGTATLAILAVVPT
jgi:hypothetical protein